MKKLSILLSVFTMVIVFNACTKADFSETYADPDKISESTVPKQFTGFLYTNKDYVLQAYWNGFVVERPTIRRWTQAGGWVNEENQYVPSTSAAIQDRWGNFYRFLAHYREMEKIYEANEEDQASNRIYMIAGTIYLYDHLQKVVDLHGNIPFSEAGRLSQNGGDYIASLPTYDSAQSIYTKMLDDLQSFSSELNSISLTAAEQTVFTQQDFINHGDIDTWIRYCNSLRLRMLTRVSGSSEFSSRAQSEISQILTSPIIDGNAENVQITVYDQSTNIHSRGFQGGLEDWNGNLAGKVMIDHMLANTDPRLRVMFQPGPDAAPDSYLGMDPTLDPADQSDLIQSPNNIVSTYNWSTLSRNDYFPGVLITSSEVEFLKAEAYLNAGNDDMAKSSYEAGVANSVNYYYDLRAISNNAESPALVPLDPAEIDAYLLSANVSWDDATSDSEKLELIATQKWIHFSVVQLQESWAEMRRLDAPSLNFLPDSQSIQSLPPSRWYYPDSERDNNTENYQANGSDDLNTKIFWDN